MAIQRVSRPCFFFKKNLFKVLFMTFVVAALDGCVIEEAERECSGLRALQSSEDQALDAKLYGQTFTLSSIRDAGSEIAAVAGAEQRPPVLKFGAAGELSGYTGVNDVFSQTSAANPHEGRALVRQGELKLCGAVAINELVDEDQKLGEQEARFKKVLLGAPKVVFNGSVLELHKDGLVLVF